MAVFSLPLTQIVSLILLDQMKRIYIGVKTFINIFKIAVLCKSSTQNEGMGN